MWSVLVAALQAIAPAIITMSSLYVIATLVDVPFDQQFVALSAVASTLALLLLQPHHYTANQIMVDRMSLALNTLARWGAVLSILFAIGYATKISSHFSRLAVLTWAGVTPLVLILIEIALIRLARVVRIVGSDVRKAVFAGCNEVSLTLAERLLASPETRILSEGYFDDRGLDRLGVDSNVPLLGKLPDLARYVKANGIDMIFVVLPMRHIQRVIDLLDELRDTTASIYYVPDIFVFDLIQARTGEVAGMPVVAMCETPFFGYRGIIKRFIDVSIAGAALVLLLPVLLVISACIKLTSAGPLIFKQKRYGLDGEQITIYKFRSMTVLEDGDRVEQARKGDHRLTRIGGFLRRASLDELPQLINVLQGRMSLVGPRPHAVAHNEEYRRLIKGYMIRHKVRPGITGLAQVNGCRGETVLLEEMQARVRYDLDYLRRWSPALDLQILWRTLLMLFRRDDKAY